MNAGDGDLTEFIESLTWSGKNRLEFLLYAVRTQTAPAFHAPNLAAWPSDTTFKQFDLHDDAWPIVVELFEIYTPALPPDYEALLTEALSDMMRQDAVLSWYMYEGAFGDIRDLFTPWHAQQMYGLALPEQSPVLAILPATRQQSEWTGLVADAARSLYQSYPSLKTLDTE